MLLTRRALALLVALLALPASASAAGWAVGTTPVTFARVHALLPGARVLLPGRALLARGIRRPHVRGAAYVERVDTARTPAFDNTEPLAPKQFYLPAARAWDFWATPPKLVPVRVAVIDSGIDGGHPDLIGRVVAAQSFVGGSAYRDTVGHGTFVAGEIAANPFDGNGIAGLAFDAQLMVAKVVGPDGLVSLLGEVQAIRWAADNGARVINLSFAGVRDPFDAHRDTYSPLEQAAIAYAYGKGVVVVAAVGNGTESPKEPWPFANYPAALPHVIGVSASRADGSVPAYSNRDAIYNDLTAPGDGIFSTIPRNLVENRAGCANRPYSDCGPPDFRNAIGTSFAAPLVTAGAALMLGQRPGLRPEQVAWLLERTAADATTATGCVECPPGRDAFTGWGRLDIAAALAQATSGTGLPPADSFEPNDDAGPWSHPFGAPRTLSATVDYWDDQIDVYAVRASAKQQLFARLSLPTRAAAKLVLWRPGTTRVEGLHVALKQRVGQSTHVGTQERIAVRVPATGTYYLEVKLVAPTQDPVAYRLALARR